MSYEIDNNLKSRDFKNIFFINFDIVVLMIQLKYLQKKLPISQKKKG